MGLFNFFSSRRKRESAIPAAVPPVPGQDASKPVGQVIEGSQAFGNPFAGAAAGAVSLTDLPGLTKQLKGIMQSRGEIMDVLKQHGIDGTQAAGITDPEEAARMQQQIVEVLKSHGIAASVPGGEINFADPRTGEIHHFDADTPGLSDSEPSGDGGA